MAGSSKNTDTIDEGEGEFIWSKETQGIILSSFYWGFTVAQLLGAWFSSLLGAIITLPVVAQLCEVPTGWSLAFYITGGCGFLWVVFWGLLVYDSPDVHPRISSAERLYITHSIGKNVTSDLLMSSKIPWCSILTSRPVWAITMGVCCISWGYFMFQSCISQYLHEVLFFDISKNGIISALPFIGFFLVLNVSGACSDFMMKRRVCSTVVLRKIWNVIGLVGAAVSIVALGFLDSTQPVAAVTVLVITVSMLGVCYNNCIICNIADIAPRYSGIVFGFVATVGFLVDEAVPVVVGVVTAGQTQAEWRTMFFICAGVYLFGAIFYCIFASGQIQDWAQDDDENRPILNGSHAHKDECKGSGR
ncbi:vesicular glutamate transporter 3 [Aplysia californica]|uniref:Vesicular glutamate transporter 3 n=1 Tax=Aplysia californica TaxID=6500 RepID=A0ABM1VR22_APLCA|nr:vesicular glutamate transporter 3 [Aplysia californica]